MNKNLNLNLINFSSTRDHSKENQNPIPRPQTCRPPLASSASKELTKLQTDIKRQTEILLNQRQSLKERIKQNSQDSRENTGSGLNNSKSMVQLYEQFKKGFDTNRPPLSSSLFDNQLNIVDEKQKLIQQKHQGIDQYFNGLYIEMSQISNIYDNAIKEAEQLTKFEEQQLQNRVQQIKMDYDIKLKKLEQQYIRDKDDLIHEMNDKIETETQIVKRNIQRTVKAMVNQESSSQQQFDFKNQQSGDQIKLDVTLKNTEDNRGSIKFQEYQSFKKGLQQSEERNNKSSTQQEYASFHRSPSAQRLQEMKEKLKQKMDAVKQQTLAIQNKSKNQSTVLNNIMLEQNTKKTEKLDQQLKDKLLIRDDQKSHIKSPKQQDKENYIKGVSFMSDQEQSNYKLVKREQSPFLNSKEKSEIKRIFNFGGGNKTLFDDKKKNCFIERIENKDSSNIVSFRK